MTGLLIGLDIGTSSIKAVCYDPDSGTIRRQAHRPTPTYQPRHGWYEHDPELVWRTIAACLNEVAAGEKIDGLAISSMGEAGLPLDKNNRPLYPVVAWYDTRCEPQVSALETVYSPAALHAITGQRINTSFGAIKWLWFKETEPELAKQAVIWLSLPDYILWRMTGEFVTDMTIASRTLLFDQCSRQWSSELLTYVGLEDKNLPTVLQSGVRAGCLTSQAADACGLPDGTACMVGGHDHLCAAFSAGGFQEDILVDSIGTAEALLMFLPDFYTSEEFAQAEYPCYVHVIKDLFVLKAGNKMAGGAVDWWARHLTGITDSSLTPPFSSLQNEARVGVGKRAGPLWLPHWGGYASPAGDRYSRAALIGVKVDHDRGDLFRAQLESLALWTRHNRDKMQDLTGNSCDRLVMLGGTARLELLAQLKADALGIPVLVPGLEEGAAVGAAFLAGLGCGVFNTPMDAWASLRYEEKVYSPHENLLSWYTDLYEQAYKPLYSALCDIHHAMRNIELGRNLG